MQRGIEEDTVQKQSLLPFHHLYIFRASISFSVLWELHRHSLHDIEYSSRFFFVLFLFFWFFLLYFSALFQGFKLNSTLCHHFGFIFSFMDYSLFPRLWTFNLISFFQLLYQLEQNSLFLFQALCNYHLQACMWTQASHTKE